MIINRHNYEEYFILYADNELSSEDRRMVEEFASLNPDLKDELDSFCSTVLLPDPSVQFTSKEELLRYDDSLISYIDDELPANEKAELEKLVAATPSLQKELELYRKTKLQPEEIVFENKSVLYRSTERKVVRMAWVRWAAAAVILLAVSVTAITVFNNSKKNNEETATVNPQKINTKSEAPEQVIADNTGKQATAPASEGKKTDNPDSIPGDNQQLAKKDGQQKNLQPKKINQFKPDLPEDKNQVIAANTSQKTNNLTSPESNPYVNGSDPDKKTIIDIGEPVSAQKNNVNGITTASVDVTNRSTGSYINTDNREIIYPEEEGGGNKKSRGLLRKLTRVFEKNTGIKATTDDDKLHIMAFTVKLK